MSRLVIEIVEVENGYVIYEGSSRHGYMGKSWVARTIKELNEVITSLTRKAKEKAQQ